MRKLPKGGDDSEETFSPARAPALAPLCVPGNDLEFTRPTSSKPADQSPSVSRSFLTSELTSSRFSIVSTPKVHRPGARARAGERTPQRQSRWLTDELTSRDFAQKSLSVGVNLGFECFRGGEFPLLAVALDEFELHPLAIEILVELDEVRFDDEPDAG